MLMHLRLNFLGLIDKVNVEVDFLKPQRTKLFIMLGLKSLVWKMMGFGNPLSMRRSLCTVALVINKVMALRLAILAQGMVP